MDDKSNNKIKSIIFLLIILILLYLLIQNFGYIDNKGPLVPTGNVDIFEIDCDCCKYTDNFENGIIDSNKKNDKSVIKEENDIDKNKVENEISNDSEVKFDSDSKDLTVFDNYKVWDKKELRIFSNPAYEYESIIAPGSSNSYAFVIRNNNSFDVIVDIIFEEMNESNINMKYKLKHNGNYLIGTEDTFETIRGKKISQVKLPAKSQKSYILDWKWVDSENDTKIGFDANSTYKLSIQVGAN